MRSKTCALIALSGVAALTLLPVHAIASRVAAQIQLLPSAGPPTRHVEARGRGFQSGEIVDLTFGGALVRKTSADQSGTFGTRFTVPSQELPGPHDVTATGEMSGITASAAFVVRTDWPTYQFSSNRDGTNPFENVLDPSNVSNLGVVWKESLGDVQIGSSPIVWGC